MKDRLLAVIFAISWLGCTHAKTTDTGAETPAKPEARETNGKSTGEPDKKVDKNADKNAEKKSENKSEKKAEKKARDDKAVPVVTSVNGLMNPGADEKIRDKLAGEGLMKKDADGESHDSMRAALKRFQEDHNFPATGTPDVQTVRALGLDPDDIFRKAATE